MNGEIEREREECPARDVRTEEIQPFRDVHRVGRRKVVGRPEPVQLIERFGLAR